MSFANTLKELLEEKGITQTDFAKAIGYSQRAISKWVNHQAEPSETAIRLTAKYFGLSTDELLGVEEVIVPVKRAGSVLSEEEEEVLKLFRQMNRAQKVRFVGFGEGMISADTSQKKA